MGWKCIGVTSDSFIIEGVDVFKEDWENTGKVAHVIDPLYGQKYEFIVWKVKKADKAITFASGEFSNNVFGVYINK